jgi:thrombospondin motif-containing protein 9
MSEQLGAYEIVTPERVNEAGDNFPTSVHFKRKKRSVEDSPGNSSDQWALPSIHYKISAFGQNYHLNLTPESGFIAPLYTVTVLGAPIVNITDFTPEEETEEDTEYQHCFYKGHVNAQTENTAVISLCSGLVSPSTLSSPPLIQCDTMFLCTMIGAPVI